jgi:hypothetical protein
VDVGGGAAGRFFFDLRENVEAFREHPAPEGAGIEDRFALSNEDL